MSMTPEERKQKKLEMTRVWRLSNKDKIREYNHRRDQEGLTWQKLHPEEAKLIKKKSAQKHHAKTLEKRRRWLKENKKLHNTRNREYIARKRKEDPKGQMAKTIAWQRGEPQI